MNNFTPGPWKIEGVAITNADGSDTVALCTSTKANARLIVKAPEMHEELIQLRQDKAELLAAASPVNSKPL